MFDANTDRGQAILSLIRLSPEFGHADRCIEELCGITDIKQKIEFIDQQFGPIHGAKTEPSGITEQQRLESDYFCLLSTVINEKWSG